MLIKLSRSFEIEITTATFFIRLPFIGQAYLSKCPHLGWEWTYDRVC